ncbi:alpha/beta hydrolase [Massilia forsythiae]|uniref:Alpha/beta hydrolase n=1 Tax=Massilia forsythiae TaxID=2728020 RepID=A0A7Z2ZUK1_9BURK|nr:alpha/beta hydrolase [Massilia forsythiae]QJE02771.1 alpha/beta hydrolase [Massilia forsythiae]
MNDGVAGLVTSALAGASTLAMAAPVSSSTSSGAFARPHQLVDIGGRKMNLYCSGQGATTVVFDAPSGEAGWNWFKVQPAVARRTRACVFDRAGLGFSDSAGRPNTAENVAQDLHKLLAGADVRPPYVLVGNSLGGANVQVYAYRYPTEVKGLVLVEPQHEDETSRLDKASRGNLKKVYAMVAQQNDYCLAAAVKGFRAGSEEWNNCIGNPAQSYGPALGAAVTAATTRAAYWRVNADEWHAIPDSDGQLRKLRRPFGDLPVIVLTRGVSPYAVPGKPQSALNKAMEDENAAIHKETAALSTRGKQRVVADAGHVIHADKPQAVVDAVLEVVGQVK